MSKSTLRTARLVSAEILGALVCTATFLACSPDRPAERPAADAGSLSPVAALAGPAVRSPDGSDPLAGYARADGPIALRFPEDHGPHPDFRTEWWYLTGNLEGHDGRRYGFQWTVFRRATSPEPVVRSSSWASRQLYMGHFTLSRLDAPTDRQFRSFERFSRGGAGLAGATTPGEDGAGLRVWLENWSLESVTDAQPAGNEPPIEPELFPLRLRASEDGTGLDLRLEAEKPRVLQGDRGYSPKNDLPGGASYYYSYTRLRATGTVLVDGQSRPVTGRVWFDREWSTSVLANEQEGWDWFSLQLDDGRDLMVYGLRRRDGAPDPFAKGLLVDADGGASQLDGGDFAVEVLDRWQSPRSGGQYPSRWRIRVPDHGLDLEVETPIADQELDVSFRYWEGSVVVRPFDSDGQSQATAGSASPASPMTGAPGPTGRGYVELVGYADRAAAG